MLPESLAHLRLPVIAAPMFLVSSVELVAACCASGVIGTLAAHNARSSEDFGAWLKKLEALLADVPNAAPYAVNLNVNKARGRETQRLDTDLALCVAHKVPLVITSVGDPAEVVQVVHGYGGRVFHDVAHVRHADKAIAAGVDGVILVCAGAGGHSGGLSPFAFVPQVRRRFAGVIVLGGAISDGRSIRAAEVLGADLVYMGTRFLATSESAAGEPYKAMVVEASSADVIYTPKVSGVPANFLAPSLRAGGFDPAELPEIYKLARTDPTCPKPWKELWSAGQGSGQIDDVPSVATLVERLESEYRAASAPVTSQAPAKPQPAAARTNTTGDIHAF